MARRQFNSDVERAIGLASQRFRFDPNFLRRVVGIESSGNPRNTNGTFHGLFAMSQAEFRRGGGRGDVFDPTQNALAATSIMSANRAALENVLGRPPTDTELYMAHQQGIGGAIAHIRNPDAPAWQNMYGTAEGQRRGPDWARRAVVGNIPDGFRHLGENITSRQFMDAWSGRFGGGGEQPEMVATANRSPQSVGLNPAGTPTEMPDNGTITPDYEAGVSVSPYHPPQSPYQTAGLEGVIQNPALSNPTVQGVNPLANMSMSNIGAGLSAAGKAIASSKISIPQFPDPERQMAALDQGSQGWPTIPVRPRRQMGPQRS